MPKKKSVIFICIIFIALLTLYGCSSNSEASKEEIPEDSILKKVTSMTLSKVDFAQLEELKVAENLEELKIVDLVSSNDDKFNGRFDFASYFPNLDALDVNTNYNESKGLDLSGLTGTKLRTLTLCAYSSTIVSLEPLSELTNLNYLTMHVAGSLSLEPIAQCDFLDTIILSCDNTDITPLASLPNLRDLRIVRGVEDISGLSSNRSLRSILLGTSTTGLETLSSVPLKYIAANGSPAFKLKQLQELHSVEEISISDEYIDDLTPLYTMENIKKVNLSVADGGMGSGIEITSPEAPELDYLETSIPVDQLRDFLKQDGRSLVIFADYNR